MKKYLRYLGSVLVAAVFFLAVYLLYHKLKSYSIAQIRESISQISHGRILCSLLLMVVNYIILVGYDWLALKAIHKTLPLPRVGLVSFVGQAVSYNFGALLGGTSVRYRFYSAWGFSLAEIVRLVLMLAVTFWVGALGLCGLIFIISPPVIPDDLLAKMPMTDVRILGVVLLLIACSYLILCCTVRKPVHLFGKEFVFPPPHIAFAQALVAGVDIIAAAGCMSQPVRSSGGGPFTSTSSPALRSRRSARMTSPVWSKTSKPLSLQPRLPPLPESISEPLPPGENRPRSFCAKPCSRLV